MRMRFSKIERETFTVGADVEIRNGSHWYPATVTGPIVAADARQEIPCRVTSVLGRKGTVLKGDAWNVGPTRIRPTT